MQNTFNKHRILSINDGYLQQISGYKNREVSLCLLKHANAYWKHTDVYWKYPYANLGLGQQKTNHDAFITILLLTAIHTELEKLKISYSGGKIK
jgi:hypothetical protein